jgi:hypothetical protein
MVASISFAQASRRPSRVAARPATTTTAPGAPSQLSTTCTDRPDCWALAAHVSTASDDHAAEVAHVHCARHQ